LTDQSRATVIQAPVISNEEAMPGVRLLWLEAQQIARVASPGQFVMVCCGRENLLRRPMSIHRTDKDKSKIALLFTVVGKGTSWLSQRQPGEKLDLLGPLGEGFSVDPASFSLLLVAGGLGIAPLAFLAETAAAGNRSIALLLGAKTGSQLCPGHLLPKGVKCFTATDDGTAGSKGIITDLLPKYLDWASQVFACGPSAMYRTIANQNRKLFRRKEVQVSLETRMACGLGLCYGCTVKTKQGLKQVCQDGPVFNCDDILWDEFVDI
jgi:dihydroorotate dehydrogenase electron transfer subunit